MYDVTEDRDLYDEDEAQEFLDRDDDFEYDRLREDGWSYDDILNRHHRLTEED